MVRRLLEERFEAWLLAELPEARERIRALRERHPSESVRALAARLVAERRRRAATGGAALGLLGWLGLPADVAVVAWLQLGLIVDVAVLCDVNLKSPRGRRALWEAFEGARAATRDLTTVAASGRLTMAAERLATRPWLRFAGRGLPLVSASVAAVLDQRALRIAGEVALRQFEDVPKAVRQLRAKGG
jgi:hypothetical protein